jgi:hypothetical protein
LYHCCVPRRDDQTFPLHGVPAAFQGLTAAKAAFASLPATVSEHYFRGDSACHQHELINWLRDEKRPGNQSVLPIEPLLYRLDNHQSRNGSP